MRTMGFPEKCRRFAARLLTRLGRDRSGVGAVEFAIIAPLLLMMYITAFELTVGLSVSKRATRSAGAIADLVTQQEVVTPSSLSAMKDVAAAIFSPYTADGMTITITGITIDADGKATVSWSWKQDGSAPYARNAAFAVPDGIRTPGSFLVHAHVAIPHELLMFMPGLMPATAKSITISREYFFRQRVGEAVTCNGCAGS